jgi:transposase
MGSQSWEIHKRQYPAPFFKSIDGRYKRIRTRPKGKPDTEYYRHQVGVIAELEHLSETGEIDLYYGDESHVCSQGYVPYGWQFPGEDVHIPVDRSYKINILGFINRKSQFMGMMTEYNVGTDTVIQYLEQLSFCIKKKTVLILDNASVHKSNSVMERIPFWQQRGLFITFLPPYSPHLNIAETVWRKLKKEWLDPKDYLEKDSLRYATNRWLAALGNQVYINFCHFNENLF